jgi:hypothetical protein
MGLCEFCTEDQERDKGLIYSSARWRMYAHEESGIYICRIVLKNHETALNALTEKTREEGFDIHTKLRHLPETRYMLTSYAFKIQPHLHLEATFTDCISEEAHPCNPGIQLMSDSERIDLFRNTLQEYLSKP